jgi:hypothetical protein
MSTSSSQPQTPRKNHRVKALSPKLGQRRDLPPADARRFHHQVASFVHGLPAHMMDHIRLCLIRRKAAILAPVARHMHKRRDRFGDLAAVTPPAASEHDRDARSVVLAGAIVVASSRHT